MRFELVPNALRVLFQQKNQTSPVKLQVNLKETKTHISSLLLL